MRMSSKSMDTRVRMGACALALALAFGSAGLAGCGSSAPSSSGDAGSQNAQTQGGEQASAPAAVEHDTWVSPKSTLRDVSTPPADATWQGSDTQTVSTTEYDEHGNLTKRHNDTTYKSDSANQAQTSDEEFTYDDKGYLISTTSTYKFDHAGEQIEDQQTTSYKNEYDDQGRLAKQSVNPEVKSNWSNQVYTYEYNEAGYISRVTNSYTDTSEGSQPYVHDIVTVSEYDEKGVLQTETTTITNKEDGTQLEHYVITYKYEYDDQGRPISATATSDTDSSYSFEWKGTYDQTGNIATEKMTRKSNTIGEMTTEATSEWKKVDDPSMATKQNYHIYRYR